MEVIETEKEWSLKRTAVDEWERKQLYKKFAKETQLWIQKKSSSACEKSARLLSTLTKKTLSTGKRDWPWYGKRKILTNPQLWVTNRRNLIL